MHRRGPGRFLSQMNSVPPGHLHPLIEIYLLVTKGVPGAYDMTIQCRTQQLGDRDLRTPHQRVGEELGRRHKITR